MSKIYVGPTDEITNDPFFQMNNDSMASKILFVLCRYLSKMNGWGMTVSKNKFDGIEVDTSEFKPEQFSEEVVNMYIALKKVSSLYEAKYPDEKDLISLKYLVELEDTRHEGASFMDKQVSTSIGPEGDTVIFKMTVK